LLDPDAKQNASADVHFQGNGGYSGVGHFTVTLLAGIPTTTIGRISVAWDANAGTNQKAAVAATATRLR
jgi:hypothetical protein